MIIYDDRIWCSYMMIIYDNHTRWTFMMIIYDDHIWWSYVMIIYDDHIWWSYMMIIYGDHIWWSYMMIIYDVHIWWSYMMVINDIIWNDYHFRVMLGSFWGHVKVICGSSKNTFLPPPVFGMFSKWKLSYRVSAAGIWWSYMSGRGRNLFVVVGGRHFSWKIWLFF